MKHELLVPDRIRDIVREPAWYDQLGSIQGALALGAMAVEGKDTSKKLLRKVFAQLLGENAVALGEAGPNWDADRQVIDTIVVHHTSYTGPIDLELLNATHLLNLYVPKYRNPGDDLEVIGGTPVYSGHADKAGKQVFYGYHWLIRSDGSREHLLPDEAIGWHAGNWEVNTRSVAVCFDGDFEHGQPPQQALDSAAELIARTYADVSSARILGHKAITETVCPGNDFAVWGEELRALVDANRAAS